MNKIFKIYNLIVKFTIRLKMYHPPFEWIFSLFIIAIVAIPIVVVWTDEFSRWYNSLLAGKENRADIRITYAIVVTIVSILLLYLIYQITPLFHE